MISLSIINMIDEVNLKERIQIKINEKIKFHSIKINKVEYFL